MKDFSLLIGGKAGFGIDKSGLILAKIFNRLGFKIYIYRDYPSLIRGGHTFSIIRASVKKIATHRDKVDFVLALNQETIDLHRGRLKKDCLFIYDSDQSKDIAAVCGTGVSISAILKEENAPEIMRNTCIIGAFVKSAGIKREILEEVLRKEIPRDLELNLKVAFRGFEQAKELIKIEPLCNDPMPLISGNEAMGLGLVKAGLKNYLAYPMTPTSPVLHFLAELSEKYPIKVIHPESEISVALMALGFASMGQKSAVGTSGGGFCLMTEGVSFSGMGELPVVFIVGQRPGPSTGLPTYSAQTELNFVMSSGQGEFPRLVVAPGDAEEAYYWAGMSLNLAWKYQLPAFILSDKNMGEGIYSFDMNSAGNIEEEPGLKWGGAGEYKRYSLTKNGVSPLAFAPLKDQVIKINSYEHDEYGITIEDSETTILMQDKRLRKEQGLCKDLEKLAAVKVYGNKKSKTAILCWGSNKGVCIEAAEILNLKVIQPLVFSPFPVKQLQKAFAGVKKTIAVENNATGQLSGLVNSFDFKVDKKILKYDGRPFSLEELQSKIKRALK
ncbi:MAG: 2-oxoacid:acceptor oxidoreductase subunit alpha [Candidatus Omnitrophica bacterium]|nr:2-oxoacid:acceptor oxidoreductase subunit alpha [Candidatus Omnitrophota bacterium]